MKGRDGTELSLASNTSSLLDLGADEDNNTVAIGKGELSALLAEAQDQSRRVTSRPGPMVGASGPEIRQREAPLPAVPELTDDPSPEESAVMESYTRNIESGRIVDSQADADGLDDGLDVPTDLAGETEVAVTSPEAKRSPF